MIRITLACLICLLTLTNCASDPTIGYSSNSLYANQYKSVAVPIFHNSTTNRNIEFMLTDAVIKEIQARTQYRILSEQFADTLLTGTITNVELDMLSQSRTTKLDNEMLLEVTMDFEWLDLQRGERIVGRDRFTASSLFIPSQPSSEPIEMGQFAVVQQLASDIVDQMQSSW
jgi:hypothetical protein